jgi:uncharacterized protein (DUF2236 family)
MRSFISLAGGILFFTSKSEERARPASKRAAGNHSMISANDLEAELSLVRARAAGPRAGVFGPESGIWNVDREAAIFLGAGRALLLQLAHPWVAAAIAEHSKVFADPIGRFHRTFRTMFTMVFGTLDQAFEAARRLHARHAEITGLMPITAGPFAAGSPYFANENSALRWVHATLIETALIARDLVLPALSAQERARYYAESRTFGALFGIPQADLPPTWEEFIAYNEACTRRRNNRPVSGAWCDRVAA